MQIAIIYHSGFGHTKAIAQSIVSGAQSVSGVTAHLLETAEATAQFDLLNQCDGIIFGCPTYMGSVSAGFKAFMEATSSLWFEGKWRDKIAAGFTNSHSLDGDKHNTLTDLAVFAAQHGMIWVNLGIGNESGADDQVSGDPKLKNRLGSSLGLVAQSENDAPDVTPPEGDHATAEIFGQRIASATQRWIKGA